MGWTKRQLIEQAFNEIGLASFVYDLTPNQLDIARRQLDSLAATWNAKGVIISFPLNVSPNECDLDLDTNVPDSAVEALYTNLAIRLAPSYGKVVSMETKMVAKDSYDALLSIHTKPREMQLPGEMPYGQGNKPWRFVNYQFLRKPINRLNEKLSWLIT